MAVNQVFAGIAVADIDTARDWYERLLGRPADLIPNATEAAWQLTDTGWVYVVVDGERCGRSLLTLLVDDLDERVAGIAARGVVAVAVEAVPGVGREVVIADPDGNRVKLAQVAPRPF
jgi:catechol 2,3-dioxygenase-like lactoylglutathione lyase family enzyme